MSTPRSASRPPNSTSAMRISRRPRSTPRSPAACSKARFPISAPMAARPTATSIVDASGGTPGLHDAQRSRRRARAAAAAQRGRFRQARRQAAGQARACAPPANSQRAIMSNLDGTVFAGVPGRRHRGPQRRADDPLADLEHAVGLAGEQGADHRPDPALAPRSASRRARRPRPISIWSARWCKMTGAGTIDLGTQDAGVPGRAEAGDDHRGPGPHRRPGRASASPW